MKQLSGILAFAALFIVMVSPVSVLAHTYSYNNKDKTPPVISRHDNITIAASSNSGSAVTYAVPTATDARDGSVPVSCTPHSGSVFPVGKTTVRCSAQDTSGNKASSSFTVTVTAPPRDHTPPKILSLHIQSNNSDPSKAVAGDKVTISFTANEAVTPVVLVESKSLFAKATNSGGNSWEASYIVSPKDHLGKVNYIITLVDTSHNIYVCSSAHLLFIAVCQTTDGSSVTVGQTMPPPQDTTAPVIQVSNMVVDADDASGATVTYDPAPIALDDTDGSVPVSCTPTSGSHFAVGVTTVTCTAQDAAHNTATATFTVTVNPFVDDTTPPTISEHDDVAVDIGEGNSTAVTYDLPTASDDTDPNPTVACTPASGSTFSLGDTPVTCTATDAAGNSASTSFTVTVNFVPQPFVMASQPDDSHLCTPYWSTCYSGGSSQVVIPLGKGSDLGKGTIRSVTIAKEESSPYVANPWIIEIRCYTTAARTTQCPDWAKANAWNGFQTSVLSEFATSTTDNKYWTAYFTDPSHESNFNDTFPVTFNPDYYYDLKISDNGWGIGAYGSNTDIYWVLTGMTTP